MTFNRNNALCYGQGFFSPNLVAIEQKNKTKQNKQTLLQGYHHFHWNRELHEFPKLSPPPPPATILTLHRKYAFPELFHCTTLSYKFFAIHKSPLSLMKKIHTPQFHHPPPFQNKTTTTTTKNTSLSPYIWYLSIL